MISTTVGNRLTIGHGDTQYAWTYDVLNRPTSENNIGSLGLPSLILTSQCDAVGNRTAVFDNYGVRVDSVYSDRSELVSKAWSGSAIDDLKIAFTYNDRGNRVSATRYSNTAGTAKIGSSSYGFDASGRKTSAKTARKLFAIRFLLRKYSMRWLYKKFSRSLGRFLFGELEKLIANNEFDRALRYANYLRPRRPKELGPVIYAAKALNGLGRYSESIEVIDQALASDYERTEPLAWRAKVRECKCDALYELGQFGKLRDFAAVSEEEFPENVHLLAHFVTALTKTKFVSIADDRLEFLKKQRKELTQYQTDALELYLTKQRKGV